MEVKVVSSPIGDPPIDCEGSAIGAARMDPELSYSEVPVLLKQVIDEGSVETWAQIKSKIDYTYECLDIALGGAELGNKIL